MYRIALHSAENVDLCCGEQIKDLCHYLRPIVLCHRLVTLFASKKSVSEASLRGLLQVGRLIWRSWDRDPLPLPDNIQQHSIYFPAQYPAAVFLFIYRGVASPYCCHEMKKLGVFFISWPDFPGICAKQGHKMKNSMHSFISRQGQMQVAGDKKGGAFIYGFSNRPDAVDGRLSFIPRKYSMRVTSSIVLGKLYESPVHGANVWPYTA